jgi:nucleotide-binding universal stress UspA family protein
MPLRVMLPTDDSPSARVAEAWVARLRWKEPPTVDVVTVASRGVSRLGWSMDGDRQVIREALEAVHRGELLAAERVANEVGERLQRTGLMARTWSRQGDTRDELLAHIDMEWPDLLVIGPRGRSTVATMLLGSVTQDMVEHAPCPVLVARPPESEEGGLPRHILLLVDGSLRGEEVVSWLERTGWLDEARLTVAGLLGERDGLEWNEPELVEDVARAVREDAVATLEPFVQPLIDRGLDVDVALLEGHPLQAASEAAAERAVDLIAIPRMARRPGGDAFSEKVARYAPVSVLIVPLG